jgi:hypothetical protein
MTVAPIRYPESCHELVPCFPEEMLWTRVLIVHHPSLTLVKPFSNMALHSSSLS